MNITQIQNIYQSVLRFLSAGQLKLAFDKIQTLTNELQNADFQERLNSLQQNYRYMLQYYIDGVEDPQRVIVYNKLIASVFSLNEEICEDLFSQNSTTLEYTRKRYFPHSRKHWNLSEMLNTLRVTHNEIRALSKDDVELHQEEIVRLHINKEAFYPELFNLFWLSTHFRSEEKELFKQIIFTDYPGESEKSLLVSALTLNLWRMFDEGKLIMLFDCAESDNQQVRQRALVGLCFVLAKYNQFLPYFPKIRNRLVIMSDDEHTLDNFRNIIMQIIGTTETEKINKKLQEEILPEIAKITPRLKDKKDIENLLNSDDWDEANPAWQELIEESGVGDKIKELSDLQMEGADVYMSTFSMLKSFSFFSELPNWFLPFDADYSAIYTLFQKEEKRAMSTFVNSQVMCNSDLYSFCLSVMQMPESQRSMLKHSFKMESEQLDEIRKDEALLTPDLVAKNISKQYIQDLFRFFKLYPQKADFESMFNSALSMHRTFLFDILAVNSRLKTEIAEYYFSKKLYVQALELFKELQKTSEPTSALYQKIGYAYQKTMQPTEALSAYLKADMIQPDDIWTLKKIAFCYRLLGNFEKALELYQHIDFLKPDENFTLMQIANCFVNLERYKEALVIYTKLEALDENNLKIKRAILWVAFISANIQQADYYLKIMMENNTLTAQDYLNAGHISWSLHRKKEAVTYYVKSLALQQNNWNLFYDAFKQDERYLKSNGIDTNEIPLMLDEVLFQK